MAGLWSRMRGRDDTVAAQLKRITHSELTAVPKELLAPMLEASSKEEDRAEIMKHLRECFAETTGKNWQITYGAMLLTEALVKEGSPAIVEETAEGRHFDLVQRLSFLQLFQCADKRAVNLIRTKAEALRKEVVPLLQSASLKDENEAANADVASTCSPGALSTITDSTTVSEPAQNFDLLDFTEAPEATSPSMPAAQAQSEDLLDFMDTPSEPAAKAPAAQSDNLLDFMESPATAMPSQPAPLAPAQTVSAPTLPSEPAETAVSAQTGGWGSFMGDGGYSDPMMPSKQATKAATEGDLLDF